MSTQAEGETCLHEKGYRLLDAGEHGDWQKTDWDYCPSCGGLHHHTATFWHVPNHAAVQRLQLAVEALQSIETTDPARYGSAIELAFAMRDRARNALAQLRQPEGERP